MNLTALMGLFLVLAVFGAFVIGLIVTIIACISRRWKLAKRTIIATLAVVVAGAVVSIGIMLFVWRPYDPTSPTELGEAYRADFGALPPEGITVLKARQIVIGDAGGQWLLLKASPDEITRHIAMGFSVSSGLPDFEGKGGANAPKWWTPSSNRLQLYENQNWTQQGGWSDSRAAIGVDRDAGLIWFVAKKMN